MTNKSNCATSPARLMRLAGLAVATVAFALPAARADTYLFGILVGNGAALDHTDGTGKNARLFNPTSIAVDAAGTLYVADGGAHTVRKITAGGVVGTLAGASGQPGSNDGFGSDAHFQYPYAVAVDGGGNVYVTDIGDHTIRKITAAGAVSTLAGTVGVAGLADGVGTAAQFNSPQGIAVDTNGNVYVADTNNSTIRKIAPNGTVTTLAGVAMETGTSDGAGSGARLNYPFGLATDPAGNIYVADFGNSAIRKITPGGSVTTLAGNPGQTGTADGDGTGARFDHPGAVSVDAAGNVYVVDTSNQAIRRITPGGSVTTLAGSVGMVGKTDGTGTTARFFYPAGIAVNSAGTTIYVADTGNHSVRAVTVAGAVSTVAGATGLIGSADGQGVEALFNYPYGLAVDGSGTIYVADHNSHTIRKITAGGGVTTLAGSSGLAGSADGNRAAAQFNGPTGVAVDANGNVFVADADNHVIRRISTAGVVTTFAGIAGQSGNLDGPGGSARFNKPQGVAVDAANNVYVADTNNSTISKITAAGNVSTFAGAAGQTGSTDGTGDNARFNGPYAVAVDSGGSVYVADFFNSTIRKISATGSVSTLAGLAGQPGSADGSGSAARFNQSYGIAVDASGNVFVADTYNRAIRKITSGVVTTLNGPLARFYYPQGLAVDGAGNLYVADGDNQTITKAVIVESPPNGTLVASKSAAIGQRATFALSSAVSGVAYQWQVSADNGATWTALANDGTYSGATSATLVVNNLTAALNGRQYRVQLSNPVGTGTSGTAVLTVTGTPPPPDGTARIGNLSVRTQVGTGADVVIVGLTIGGNGAKQMIIRGIGPALTQFGVSGALAAPQLTLFGGNGVALSTNAGWSTASNAAAMSGAFAAAGAFPLTTGSRDSAIVQPLPTGSYTAQIAGANNTTGIGLAEFYDADTGTPDTRLTNASARAQVGTGGGVLIAGFAIVGPGTVNVLIRGIGPALTQFGVGGALAAPRITVFSADGTGVVSNAGWDGSSTLSSAFANVGAFPLVAGSGDCALLMTLSSGTYTVQLSGANNTTGVGLVEVYEAP